MATIKLKRGNYDSRPTSGLLTGEPYFFVDTKQIAIPFSDTEYAIFDISSVLLKVANNLSDLNNVSTARANLSVYSKAEVDSMIVGMTWKEVTVASTANLILSGEQTIDGKACITGDTVLCKNQTNATQNGVYTVATGAWTRSDFADTAEEIENLACIIQEGTNNANTVWICTTKDIILGTTGIEFIELPGAGVIIAGEGLSKDGNTLYVDINKLTSNPDPPGTSLIMIYDTNNTELRKVTISELLSDVNANLWKVKSTATDPTSDYLDGKMIGGTAISVSVSESGTNSYKAEISVTFAGVDLASSLDAANDLMLLYQTTGFVKATINSIIDSALVDGGTF
ncbi:MAG: hypothetical protein EOL88_07195 [Bacteroidia bacterium]|nr:hypothetical protein [Bacteroidia bacterium]